MKKIILITLIFCLHSFPTLGKEIKGKGLFCIDDKTGKDIALYFYHKGYEQWYREWKDFDENGQLNMRQLWHKDATTYKVNEDYITLHLNSEISKKHYIKINRYNLTARFITHGKEHTQFFNCEVSHNRNQFLEKIKYEDKEFNKRLDKKLKKRKF